MDIINFFYDLFFGIDCTNYKKRLDITKAKLNQLKTKLKKEHNNVDSINTMQEIEDNKALMNNLETCKKKMMGNDGKKRSKRKRSKKKR